MKCPECGNRNAPDAGSCERCGLLLFLIPAPKRRKEDLGAVRRRANDASKLLCRYCHGDLEPGVVSCRHCSQVVSDDFRAEQLRRRKAQVNYASWVSYLCGLFLFVFFRPVGLLAIAAGLTLSVIYYAIPVEESANSATRTSIWRRLRRALAFERVPLPLPFSKKRLVFIGTPVVAVFIGYAANFLLLQKPLNDVLKGNEAFRGMNVSAHYRYWVDPRVVVYDLSGISTQNALDVHGALVEFAQRLRTGDYEKVELSYKGSTRFEIEGSVFKKLGEESARKNFEYVLFEFPRQVRAKAAAAKIARTRTSHEALLELHRTWYADEEAKLQAAAAAAKR